MKKITKYIILFIFLFTITFNVYALEVPSVSSKNIILVNMDNDDVLYEKNADDKVAIASVTKVMTALVGVEHIDDYNKTVTVTYDMIKDIPYDYATVGFSVGEEVSYNDLLYGVLLRSGADATNILAYGVSGSIDAFVSLMNEKAKELGMNNTHYTNTIGEDDENHYSSARDLSKLLKYAYSNEKFKEFFTKEEYTLSNSITVKGPLKSLHNDDINAKYVLGGKTGYTSIAGLCLASVSNYEDINYILITIGADETNKLQAMLDSKTIYEHFFNNYKYKTILSKGSLITKVKTVYDEEYEIKSDEEVTKYLSNEDIENIKYEYEGENILQDGTLKGDKIGTYYIVSNGKLIYQKDVYSMSDVKLTFDYFIKHNIVLLIVFASVLLLLIITMYKMIKSRKNKHR